MTHDPHRCFYCGGSDALQVLRPYGPGGAAVCVGCVTDPAHPEREAAAAAMYAQAERARLAEGVTEMPTSDADTIRFGG